MQIRRLIPMLVAVVFALPAAPATAAPTTITINSFVYAPDPISVALGSTLSWTNQHRGYTHTATSDAMGFFDTGDLSFNRTSDLVGMKWVGVFPYHCTIHTANPRMTGVVKVPLTATKSTVLADARVRLSLESEDLADTVFDIQRRRLGGRWRLIRPDVPGPDVRVRIPVGTWSFRARVENTTTRSRWSPTVRIVGTAV